MSLTKADIADRLFNEVGLNKREAKEFVDAYFEVIRAALESGENVKLSGFGNFQLRLKNQRPGRNPKNGGGDSNFRPTCCDFPTRAKTTSKGRSLC